MLNVDLQYVYRNTSTLVHDYLLEVMNLVLPTFTLITNDWARLHSIVHIAYVSLRHLMLRANIMLMDELALRANLYNE